MRWLGWRVVSLLSKHGRSVGVLAALILVCTALDVAVPYLTRGVIDNILKSLHAVRSDAIRSLFVAGAAILAATALNRLLRSFYNYQFVRTAAECEDEIKNAAFGNFLRLDTAYHGAVNTGEIVGALDRGGTAVFVMLNEVLGQNLVPPALITVGEVNRLVAHWSAQANPENKLDVDIVPIEDDEDRRNVDPLCYEAAKFIIETNFASTAQLQSRFSIGHPRAVRVMKQLEEFKIVGPHEGTKPRRILIGLGELETIAPRLGNNGGQTDLFAQGA